MASDDWDPQQYERFKAQRSQPFWDLVAMIRPGRIERAVDLGCGTGELTSDLAGQLDVGTMLGVDNSPAMLSQAQRFARPGLKFRVGEISDWTSDGDHDLVLANASLQWVPDHESVLARWAAGLRSGGHLAVQVPANGDHASHLASVAVANTEPFLSAMHGAPPPDPVADNVLAPEAYAELLYSLGFAEPNVRLQVYPHVMPSTAAVVEWTKGTSLTRFFKAMPPELHDPFVHEYRSELIRRVGDHSPYLFAFKRILMHGTLR
jgi:trans-aconitate 2-methyltransferase